MTIVATSIPVLRVFFKHAVNSAIETYQNSSGRNRTRNNTSNTASTVAQVSLRRSSKLSMETNSVVEKGSKESIIDNRRRSKGYLELDDVVIDERTGRVTVATPESVSDPTEQKVPQWPL
jgi:cation transport regulator ChaB